MSSRGTTSTSWPSSAPGPAARPTCAPSTPASGRSGWARPGASPDGAHEGSLLDRMVKPQLERLRKAAARSTPLGHYERLTRDLALAGNPLRLTATDFVVVRTAASVVGAGVGGAIGLLAG